MVYARAPTQHITAHADAAAAPLAALSAPRVAIERLTPAVDCGRYPARAVIGQGVSVEADVFLDGHEQAAARLIWWSPADVVEHTAPMRALGNDRWQASFTPESPGLYYFTVEGWLDVWGSYLSDLRKNAAAGAVSALELREGSEQLQAALARALESERSRLSDRISLLNSADVASALDVLLSDERGELTELMARLGERRFITRYSPELPLDVERIAAGFASWYELFPRSQRRVPGEHGTFDDVIARLPALRAMGFDVLYLPPIHPIGRNYPQRPQQRAGGRSRRSRQSVCDRRRRGRPRRPCIRSSAASTAFRRLHWRRRRATAWKWRWISPCSARAIIHG